MSTLEQILDSSERETVIGLGLLTVGIVSGVLAKREFVAAHVPKPVALMLGALTAHAVTDTLQHFFSDPTEPGPKERPTPVA